MPALRARLDDLVKALARLGVKDREVHTLGDLAVEVELNGLISLDEFAINALDDHALLYLGATEAEWTTL